MKVGFIGIGNMGSAIVKSLDKVVMDVELLFSDYNEEKVMKLKENISKSAKVMKNEEIVKDAQIVFLGVKPNQVETLLRQLSPFANSEMIWVSMVAGLKLENYLSVISSKQSIIRMMPNTPIEIQEGMTTFTYPKKTPTSAIELFKLCLSESGKLLYINEEQMDAATAIAGCGPAFIYQMIEAFSDAGVREGLSRELAQELAVQMIKGSASMVLETKTHPALLKDRVTSPGGSTIAGITALEENGFRFAVIEAVHQACKRNHELGKIH